MTLFGSLEIGVNGLAASQLALNVTGQNISNANTDGYSRKRVELSAATRADQLFGEMGFGVEIEKIARYSDLFLEEQIRKQKAEEGYYAALDQSLERVENILTEPTDTGLNEVMDQFWNAWHDLSNNPEDVASREVVLSTSLVLEDKLHTLAQQLDDLRGSKNEDIEEEVTRANGLLTEIFALNEEVAVGEIRGGEANDSRDRRDTLIRELSNLIDVTVVEDELGRVTITTNGNVVVGPSKVVELELVRVAATDIRGEPVANVSIQFADNKKDYVPRSGEIKGLIEVRDVLVPKYQTTLNEISEAFVRSVNELHYTGYNLKHNTGIHFFNPENVRADNIAVATAIRTDSLNIAAAKGGITTPAAPSTFIPNQAVSDSIDLKTIDPNYRNIAQGTLQIDMGGTILSEGAGQDFIVDYELGVIRFIDFGGSYVGDGTEAITIDFRYNAAGFSGPGDGLNALNIAQLRDKLVMGDDGVGNRTKTIGEFYSAFMGTLGIERNKAISTLETRTFLVEQFQMRKEDITGVSLDEELADMIKFEHTYQAAARFISAINQVMDTLINL